MSAKNLFLVVTLAVLIALPLAHADSGPYLIPLEGSRWNSSIIHVHVYGGQDWQRNQTYEAMQIWNQAQLWFAREYFPNSSVYTFKADDGSAQVQVRLLNSSTVVGSIQGVDRLSRPEWYYGVGERTDCREEFQGGGAPSQPSRTWSRARNRSRVMLRKRFDEPLPRDAFSVARSVDAGLVRRSCLGLRRSSTELRSTAHQGTLPNCDQLGACLTRISESTPRTG